MVIDLRAWSRKQLEKLLNQGESFDITEAAFLIAAEEYPGLDLEIEFGRIREIGAEAARRAGGIENPFERLDRIREYFFDELAFHGNTEDYGDPRNSYINEVLNRRVGIPITLSILYMETARSAGLDCRGVGLPGHFIVRADYAGRSILVDPFHGGNILTREDCTRLVARSTGRPSLFKPELLEGATSREILLGLLRNIKRSHLAREEYQRALSAVERLLLVVPGDPLEIRDRGILMSHLGEPNAAVADLEEYLAIEPQAPDAEAVRARLTRLRKKMS